MGWIKNGPETNWADFSSDNTFPLKQTTFRLDLSVLFVSDVFKSLIHGDVN